MNPLPLRLLPLALLLSAVASSPAAAQFEPDDLRAHPHGASSVRLTWLEPILPVNELRVERDGGLVETLAPDATEYLDMGLAPNQTYVYRVAGIEGGGNAFWSGKAFAVATTAMEFLPLRGVSAANHRVGYTYGEYFRNYDPSDYHFGVDFMRIGDDATGQKEIVAPFPGRIHRVVGAGADLGVEFRRADEYYLLSHLQNVTFTAADAGSWVMAGVQVGEIGNLGTFGIYGDHCHVNRDLAPYDFATPDTQKMRHFLALYGANAFKDPAGNLPQIMDRTLPLALDADSDAFHYKVDGVGGAYLTDKTGMTPPPAQPADAYILKGKVDIVLEAQDRMGHPAKPAALYSIAYWIQGVTPGTPNVRSGAEPYMLHHTGLSLYQGAVERTNDIYEISRAQTWNWADDTCGHYVVTNTKGTAGAMSDVDPSQHWATKAKKVDGSPPNGAGNDEATKAQEAMFPDGRYRVHARARDLVGRHESHDDVWVENFPPAVKEKRAEALGFGVCGVTIVFSEPMNRTATEAAITFRDQHGADLPYFPTWQQDDTTLTLVPTGTVPIGTIFSVTIDADQARDLSGGDLGQGAFLDSEFGDPAHNGLAEGAPGDSVSFEVSCWNGCCLPAGGCDLIPLQDCDQQGGISLGLAARCSYQRNYCVANPNVAGTRAYLSAQGSLSVAAGDLTFHVTGALPSPQSFGLLIYSSGIDLTPLSNGYLCLQQPFWRLPPTLVPNAQGEVSHVLDFTNPPDPAAAILGGSTWNFQYWYRDNSLSGSGGDFNFSDAIQITFCY